MESDKNENKDLCLCGKPIVYKAKGQCSRCYQKEWRKNNPDKVKNQKKRSYPNDYEKHKDKYKERAKEWAKNNPEKFKQNKNEYMKNWIKANPDKWNKIQRTYRKKHPEVAKKCRLKKLKKETSDILNNHEKDLENDPQKLSTAYIQEIIKKVMEHKIENE